MRAAMVTPVKIVLFEPKNSVRILILPLADIANSHWC